MSYGFHFNRNLHRYTFKPLNDYFCLNIITFRSNPHLSDSELEITVVRCLNVPLQQGKIFLLFKSQWYATIRVEEGVIFTIFVFNFIIFRLPAQRYVHLRYL